jgi:hypothetical protein
MEEEIFEVRDERDLSGIQDNSYWVVIPYYLFMSDELTHREKYILGEIISLTKKEGFCWATNTYFEEKFKIPKRSIIRILNKLEEMGLIKRIVIKKDGTFRKIFLGEKLGGCAMPIGKVGTRGGDKPSTSLAHRGDKPVGKVGTPKDKQYINNTQSVKKINRLKKEDFIQSSSNPLYREWILNGGKKKCGRFEDWVRRY